MTRRKKGSKRRPSEGTLRVQEGCDSGCDSEQEGCDSEQEGRDSEQEGRDNVPYTVVDDQLGPLDEANQFLSALHARGLCPNTIRAYAFDLVAIYRWLRAAGKSLKQLQHADLLDFIRAQRRDGASPRTINRRLVTCRSLYRFRTNQDVPTGRGTSLPAPYYRGPGRDRRLGIHPLPQQHRLKLRVAVPQTLVEPLTREQVGIVLESFRRYRDLAMGQLMLLCGLRSAEVLRLMLSDVSFEESRVRICGKGDKERVLPIPDTLRETLQAYLRLERPVGCRSDYLFVVLQGARRGNPMTPAGLRSLFRHRRLKPAMANANAHRLRHTFGSDMARAGVRLAVLQRMMGHSDASTTLQYINLSMSDIAAEFQRAIAEIQRRYDNEDDNEDG